MDDGRWREERAKRLAKAVEALSGGRISGEYADRLAGLIISYAERRDEKTKKRIENLAEEVGVSREEVWDVVDFILSDMYCLARDCARDEVVRKFVAPALELIMLDKALNEEFDREEALLIFGEMYATALAGDGAVGQRRVVLIVGGELGGGAALLRLATLHLLNQLLPKELKFNARIYVDEGVYNITARGENAARFKHLLAVTAPSAGGEYLSDKFKKFVEEAKVEVRVDSIRQTEGGLVAADLTISVGGVAVKYNVYLQNDIRLQFQSTDRSRAELAARLLRHAGVGAEVEKVGGRDVWQVRATTDMLAAGREELRKALAEIVETARKSVGEEKAKRWLKKLESGVTLMEGWPKYNIQLTEGALVVRFTSTDPDSIEREAQRLRQMGLEEGRHFTVKMPEGEKAGYVSILKEGLAYAAWLSVYGKDKDQRELAADFVKIILQRAEEAGGAVYEKVKEIVKKGKERGSLELEDFEKKVEVNGKTYVVKVIGWGAEIVESQRGKKLLRLTITAEVDGVMSDYMITYRRRSEDNAVEGRTTARADAPGGREADAERFSALVKALTGKEPRIHEKSDGTVELICGRKHLDGLRRYAELADVIEEWLEETRR
jgi:IS1 family transposase